MNIGEEIKRIRHDRCISQEKLAELSGMHTGTIRGIELDIHDPKFSTVEYILEAMGMELIIVDREFGSHMNKPR